jgi:hypothetical protein
MNNFIIMGIILFIIILFIIVMNVYNNQFREKPEDIHIDESKIKDAHEKYVKDKKDKEDKENKEKKDKEEAEQKKRDNCKNDPSGYLKKVDSDFDCNVLMSNMVQHNNQMEPIDICHKNLNKNLINMVQDASGGDVDHTIFNDFCPKMCGDCLESKDDFHMNFKQNDNYLKRFEDINYRILEKQDPSKPGDCNDKNKDVSEKCKRCMKTLGTFEACKIKKRCKHVWNTDCCWDQDELPHGHLSDECCTDGIVKRKFVKKGITQNDRCNPY